MRISKITPKLFGRYRTDAPLDLPDSSIVVVYGNNEVGKTTYADLAVTLLSSTYDKDIVKRYGNYQDSLKGSIEISDSAESLTIQFKSATVPKNSGGPVKREGLPANQLWTKAQAIQSLIIRNIFRVSSHEINNRQVAIEKFDGYGLGDRNGASIRTVLADYDSKAKALDRPISDLRSLMRGLERQLSDANKSTKNYEGLLTESSNLDVEIEKTRSDEREQRAIQSQISFCEGAQTVVTTGEKALRALEELEANGQLIPVTFSDVHTRVGQIIDEIGELNVQERKHDLDELVVKLGSETQAANESLSSLSITRDAFVTNAALFSNEARRLLLGRLVETASARSTQMANSKESEIARRQSDLDDAKSELQTAESEWTRFTANVSAQQYLINPPAVSHAGSSQIGLLLPNWSYGIPVLGLIVSLISKQSVGIGFSLVFGILLAFLQFTSSRTVTQPGDETAFVHDRTLVHVAAQRVINAEHGVNSAQQNLDSLNRDEKRRLDEIAKLSDLIEKILQEAELHLPIDSDAAAFAAYFEDLKTAVQNCADERECAEQVQTQTEILDRLNQSFDKLIEEISGIYASLEMPFNPAFFISTNAACTTLENLQEDFKNQSSLRTQVNAVNELFIGRSDESEVRPLMRMSSVDRSEMQTNSESRLRDILAEREDLEARQRDLQIKVNEFETMSRMSGLRSELESVKEQLLESQFNRFQFVLQSKLLRKFATQRAQDLKPELVKNVQDMVLSVATDWKTIEFLTDSEGKIEHIEVRKSDNSVVTDSQLSSGAQSLLYLAMRVAIMQQEATNSLSIPLLCDDPLIYMDDIRTRLALQMLKEASEGHQIIYFTCKTEIRELAEEMNIPVVTI
jgi:energy-coupling factor transporter ATP-binding protein EcfA2